MIEPREINLPHEAVLSLLQIIGIMTDQLDEGNMQSRWDVDAVVDLYQRLAEPAVGDAITLGIDDAALLLDGMAFTESMSVDLPFFEMVQWTSDFVTTELRSHWTDAQWFEYSAR